MSYEKLSPHLTIIAQKHTLARTRSFFKSRKPISVIMSVINSSHVLLCFHRPVSFLEAGN